jgi:hypothetical protein
MLATRLKAKIGDDKMLVLHLPDISPGEVEVIILKEEQRRTELSDLLAAIPKHRMGKIRTMLSREDIYLNAR